MSTVILKCNYTGGIYVFVRKKLQQNFNFVHIMYVYLKNIVLHSIMY
jgi:hypothetical protein